MSTNDNARRTAAQKPIILFDVMDTLVKDPFFDRMPAFFGMSFQELLEAKHPTAWLQFELGRIDETEFAASFWRPGFAGTTVDGPALRRHMAEGYTLLPGTEPLLQRLCDAGYELHAFSNYTAWWREVEARVQLRRWLSWTFLSCEGPCRGLHKPDPEAFRAVMAHLDAPARDLVFVDDRGINVAAARKLGLRAIQYSSAEQLDRELRGLDLEY